MPATTVIGVGGHDHVLGALAAGATEPGILIDSMGTAEALFLTADAPVFDPRFFERGYPQGAVDAGAPLVYILGGVYAAGGSVEWARNNLLGGCTSARLVDLARSAEPGAGGLVFVPHLRYSAMPNPDLAARGALIGLQAETGPSDIARAVLEGVALEVCVVLDGLSDIPGVPKPHRIRAIGGGVRNDLLLEIKAACFGQPIEAVEMPEATSLGAALMAGLAAGVYQDHAQALASLDLRWREIEVDAQLADHYGSLLADTYRAIYPALRPINHSLRRG